MNEDSDTVTVITIDKKELRKLIHDLRSPLSVICSSLEVLEAVRLNPEKFDCVLQMMKSAGTELTGLLKEFEANREFQSSKV